MPALEIRVLAPSRTYPDPSRRAVVAMPATSDPASGSVIAKAVITFAGGDRPEPAVLLRRRSAQQDRRRAQPLEREHRVGERGRLAQRLAHEAAGAEIEVEDRLEPAARAEQREQGARLPPGRGVVDRLGAAGDLSARRRRQPARRRRVTRLEEGADQPGVGHGYSNLGSRLARKAS